MRAFDEQILVWLLCPSVAPRLQHAVGIAVFARPADVVHHLVVAVFFEGSADASTDLSQRLIPADALPLSAAAFTGLLEREHDPLVVIDLVDRGRALGTVAAAARRVLGVAFDLGNLAGLVVEVREQPTCRFAVEAGRRDEGVVAFDLVRPRLRVKLGPIVPLLVRRVLLQISHVGSPKSQLGPDTVGDFQLSGTDWPARTKAVSDRNMPMRASTPANAAMPVLVELASPLVSTMIIAAAGSSTPRMMPSWNHSF